MYLVLYYFKFFSLNSHAIKNAWREISAPHTKTRAWFLVTTHNNQNMNITKSIHMCPAFLTEYNSALWYPKKDSIIRSFIVVCDTVIITSSPIIVNSFLAGEIFTENFLTFFPDNVILNLLWSFFFIKRKNFKNTVLPTKVWYKQSFINNILRSKLPWINKN